MVSFDRLRMNRSSTSSSALVVLPIAETITSSRAGSAATIRARFSTPSAERTEAPPNLYILMGGMSFVFSFPCGALAAGPLPVSEGAGFSASPGFVVRQRYTKRIVRRKEKE